MLRADPSLPRKTSKTSKTKQTKNPVRLHGLPPSPRQGELPLQGNLQEHSNLPPTWQPTKPVARNVVA
eukprot:3110662-Amphidinium_carterae.3